MGLICSLMLTFEILAPADGPTQHVEGKLDELGTIWRKLMLETCLDRIF